MTSEHTDEPDPDVPSDLDERLRRLFADDRLMLPVSHDAETTLVAGARRRKRRRMVLANVGGVLAMAGIVVAGAAVSGVVHPTHRLDTATGPVLSTTVTTTTTPPIPAATAVPTTAPKDDDVLGPYGYGDLLLGMSWKDALSKGEVRESTPVYSAGCLRYTALVQPFASPAATPAGTEAPGSTVAVAPTFLKVAEIEVSVRDGVIEVIAGPRMHTPEGIGIGSTRDTLADAYPQLDLPTRGGTTSTEAIGNPKARYVFDLSGTGTVTSVSLRMDKSDCLG